jgi:hypothetical protein
MGQFLFYFRLVGVAAFELSDTRFVLFLFPNTFEYFFIFYEAVRMHWNPARIGKWTVVVATLVIWVFVKLPQEWWIHIAQMDLTDFVKEELFGVALDTTWRSAVAESPEVVAGAVALLSILGIGGYAALRRWAPGEDHDLRLAADPLPSALKGGEVYRTVRMHSRLFDRALAEKVVLTSLVWTIFVSMLPGLDAGLLQVGLSVGTFVVLNSLVTQWLARRGRSWRSVGLEFATMAVVNLGLVTVLEVLEGALAIAPYRLSLDSALFFVFLLTVLIVMFDRYRIVRLAREVARGEGEGASGRWLVRSA